MSLHQPRDPRAAPDRPVGDLVADLGTFEGVSRDLRDEPHPVELDLSKVPDGTYVVRAEFVDGTRLLGATTLAIDARRGLDTRLARLESELATVRGFDAPRADVQYPADFIRNVNRGRVQKGSFDVAKELQIAEALLAALKSGRDPFAGRTGDFERHHVLEAAAEIMPYRVYVPTTYKGEQPFPLVIALHGLGANEDSFFDGYQRQLPRLAEERGYLVAAPRGYRVDGFYGYGVGAPPEDVATRRRAELSEQDVMAVLARMKQDYRVDESRIYLIRHSMGAMGTWRLAAKYPDVWAALGPIAGMGDPETVARMRHIPQIVVHGDADPTVPVSGSRNMVAEMKRLGVTHRYIEVPGGNHIDIAVPNFPAIFDFFDAHRKVATSSAR